LNKISIWSILLPAIIGCSFYKYLGRKTKLILFLVVAACVPQLARALLGRTSFLHILYNIYIIIELLVLFAFFYKSYSSKTHNKIHQITGALAMTFGFLAIIAQGISNQFLTEWLCLNNLVFTTWILLRILDIYKDDRSILSATPSQFLYLAGLFFYTSCTILIFALWDYIMSHSDTYLKNLWIIHDSFNTIMYISFTIGFYLEFRAFTNPPKTIPDER